MLLTEQEVDALRKSLPAVCKHQDVIRAAESAVLDKLKAQVPMCWITPSGEGWMMRTEPPITDTKLGWTALYEHPQPPEPVAYTNPHGGVLHTLATGLEKSTYTIPLYLNPDPRVAELEAVLRECRDHLNDIAIHINGAEYETPLLQASEAIAKIDEVLNGKE